MTGRLEVRILGCGSSGGVPRVGNDWGACDPSDPRNRRTRCSILIRVWSSGPEPTLVLIDTSPDLREQLLAAGVTRLDAVILTHDHADQCHGIDDLRALVLRNRKRLPVYMDARTRDRVSSRFGYCFDGENGYPPILDRQELPEAGQLLRIEGPGGPLDIVPLEQDHGVIPSKGFRIGDFAYCNDVVRLSEDTLKRLKGLDLFVVDALRHAPHPTHANVETALGWIDRLRPNRAVLTNLHVDLDYTALSAMLPAHVEPAFDGMELSVDAST